VYNYCIGECKAYPNRTLYVCEFKGSEWGYVYFINRKNIAPFKVTNIGEFAGNLPESGSVTAQDFFDILGRVLN